MRRKRLGITGKLVLSSASIFGGLGVALTWYSVRQLRSLMYEQIVRRVEAQALNWIEANRSAIVLTDDPHVVGRLVADLKRREGIAYVALFDADRRMIAAAGMEAGLAETGPGKPVAGVSSRVKRTRDAAGRRYFEMHTAIPAFGTGMNRELESMFGLVGPGPGSDWLRIGIDEREISRSLSGLVSRNVVQFALLVLFALAVTITLARRMAVPITEMAGVATGIAAGNLEARVQVGANRSDEIGDLVRDFNSMAERLAENRQEMDRLYSGLEEKVRERTLALEEANRRLKDLDELKSQFLSTVSHELRSPLTSIKAFARILLDSRPDEATMRRFLEIIDKESDRLSRLISDLLDLAKIERNAMTWRVDSGDLREVVVNAVASLDSLRDAKKIHLETRVEGRYPMRADLDRIQQVITNLVGNAIKFTPAGGAIVLTLQLSGNSGPHRASEGPYARVAVSDNGPGIPMEERQAIFSKFYQGPRNRLPGAGTGLGLAISREIVLHHQGEIWVESEEGQGSTFYFTVPLTEQAAHVQSETAPRKGGADA